MIRFLNGESIAGYARIYHDSVRSNISPVLINNNSSVFLQSSKNVFITPHSGMAILQLVQFKDQIFSYYLDKTVEIKPETVFCVTAMDSPCEVCIDAAAELNEVHTFMPLVLNQETGLMIDRIYTFFDQKQPAGFLFAGERHQPYELVCVLEGTLHSIVGGQDYVLSAHQALIIPPDTWHTQYGESTNGVHFITVAFSCNALLPDYAVLCKKSLTFSDITLLKEMSADLSSEKILNIRLLPGIQFLLTPWLMPAEFLEDKSQTPDRIQHENQILDQALEFVATHIQERLSITALAKGCGVSVAYLSLLFNRHLHTSPGAYIQRIRLEQACRMLRQGTGTVAQIAFELQFSSPQHFSSAFKKEYNITPLAYARGKQ